MLLQPQTIHNFEETARDVLGVLIENYETEHVPAPTSDPVSVLKHFMEDIMFRGNPKSMKM